MSKTATIKKKTEEKESLTRRTAAQIKVKKNQAKVAPPAAQLMSNLDLYFQEVKAGRDPRMKDAVELVLAKRRKDGTWPLQQRWAGRTFFEMEQAGKPSRWNTLRALRILKWWNDG